ncbi:MAG: hypothetical protein AMXMBFR80_15790 [Dehalococcoidia bacterium]
MTLTAWMAMPPAIFQPAATIAPVAMARRRVKAVTWLGVRGVGRRLRARGRLRERFR